MSEVTADSINFEKAELELRRAREMGHTIFQASHVGSSVYFDVTPDNQTTIYEAIVNERTRYDLYNVYGGYVLEGVQRRRPIRASFIEVGIDGVQLGDKLVLARRQANEYVSPRITSIWHPSSSERHLRLVTS